MLDGATLTLAGSAEADLLAESGELEDLDANPSDEVRQLRDERLTLRAALEVMEQGVVVLDERDRIVLLTVNARESLVEHADEEPVSARPRSPRRGGVVLPMMLRRWLARHRQWARFHGQFGLAPPEQVTLEGPLTRLIVRLAGSPRPGQRLLLVQRQPTQVSTEALISLGLTAREAEVLVWVLQGKSNPEIATILDLSPRTVGKHLERVYRSLGVENRISACLLAMEHLKKRA